MELTITRIQQKIERQRKVEQNYKLGLGSYIALSALVFTYLTSVLPTPVGSAQDFVFPSAFSTATLVILALMMTVALAKWFARNNEIKYLQRALLSAALLSGAFLVALSLGWSELVASSAGSVNYSYVTLLTSFYGIQFFGVVAIQLVLSVQSFQYKVHSKSMKGISLATLFVFYMCALWLYLTLHMVYFL